MRINNKEVELGDQGELAFRNQAVDGGRDGFSGSGESFRVGVEEPNIETVNGSELSYPGPHLAAAHNSDGFDFLHNQSGHCC